MTNTFCSFLKLNSIKYNKKKTDLINNIKTRIQHANQILMVKEKLISLKSYKKAIKYLEIYLFRYSLAKVIKNKLKEKIDKFTKAIASQKGWNDTTSIYYVYTPALLTSKTNEYSISLIIKMSKYTTLTISKSQICTIQNLLIFNQPLKLIWDELHTYRGMIAHDRIPPWFSGIQISDIQ
ncbi:90_t:CDS:2 [Acaulospora colombiana]|uniref:90_t:CDS:1 n=1 Tax=Acaulospora colombiana TaxID=27376 RepID=A0ACA9K169_9GLOM|nr:90_t:CDS:2 [Acaulospora colombiana]